MSILYRGDSHKVKLFLHLTHQSKLPQEIISATCDRRLFLGAISEPAHIQISIRSTQLSSRQHYLRGEVRFDRPEDTFSEERAIANRRVWNEPNSGSTCDMIKIESGPLPYLGPKVLLSRPETVECRPSPKPRHPSQPQFRGALPLNFSPSELLPPSEFEAGFQPKHDAPFSLLPTKSPQFLVPAPRHHFSGVPEARIFAHPHHAFARVTVLLRVSKMKVCLNTQCARLYLLL